jgi:hypothetical protein
MELSLHAESVSGFRVVSVVSVASYPAIAAVSQE